MDEIPATVIVVSDDIVQNLREDRAGLVAREVLATHRARADYQIVGDDVAAITSGVQDALAAGSRLIVTVGGTGVGPTDVTVEAVAPLLSYQLPGIAEEIRRRGMETTSLSLVSRGIAGVIRSESGKPAVVLAAPGSRGGVRDAVSVVGPLLPYLVKQLDGGTTH
ncbi:MAG: molybdenum cofactor biosynthesis protein B [Propioniciclava sp.]